MTRVLLLTLTLTVFLRSTVLAKDYKDEPKYIALRDSMHHAFNDGDSARFYPAIKALEDYVLQKNDLHAYYTHRCNEIVFLMNAQKIYEAYKLARNLSQELREKKVDKEMYMAYNMLGHINRICGNRETAKENFYKALELMEQQGYYENMPPIYMNIVNVEMGDSPEEALQLLEKAREIAEKYAPERVFDIETRKTVSYYNRGDIEHFLDGYKVYKQGVAEGKSSVHGRIMEVYYLACKGQVDEAVRKARDMGEDGADAVTMVYERSGRWKEAYESLRKEYTANDSINNVVLTNSMQGIKDELTIYDAERKASRNQMYVLLTAIALLALLVLALVYIMFSRRRHMRQLKNAYQHALEADQMKTAFIQNVSHEVRTPLNIISGFSQVIADPELTESVEERKYMADMMQKSATQVTKLIDEIIGLSLIETTSGIEKNDHVKIGSLLQEIADEYKGQATKQTEMKVEDLLPNDFTLLTNKTMLKRVLAALMENATKYTEKGSITLRATSADDTLTIQVEDTGCGIPAKDAEHIFERFVKLDSFKEGIGLGLPLSRKLAEQMGGTVHLDTTYTTGSRFTVTMPVEQ